MKAKFWTACRLATWAALWLSCARVEAQYLPEYPTGELGPRDDARVRRLYTLYPTPPAGLVPCPNPTSPYGSVMSNREGMIVTTVNRPIAAETRFGVWRNNFPPVGGSATSYSYITRPNRRIVSRETARQGAIPTAPTAYVSQVIAQPTPTLPIPAIPGGQVQPHPTFAPSAGGPGFPQSPGGMLPGMPQPPGAPLGPQLNIAPNQPLQPSIAPELVPPPMEWGPREF